MTPFDTLLAIAATASGLTTLGYVSLCATNPFGPCRRCEGTGQRGRLFRRRCPRCKGTGRRLRFGRRLHNLCVRTCRNGTR